MVLMLFYYDPPPIFTAAGVYYLKQATSRQVARKNCCTMDVGPTSLNCLCARNVSAPYVDALYECIELNREACRKISKKFDKKHPDLPVTQMEKLWMYDAIMKDIVDDVESFGNKVQRLL